MDVLAATEHYTGLALFRNRLRLQASDRGEGVWEWYRRPERAGAYRTKPWGPVANVRVHSQPPSRRVPSQFSIDGFSQGEGAGKGGVVEMTGFLCFDDDDKTLRLVDRVSELSMGCVSLLLSQWMMSSLIV